MDIGVFVQAATVDATAEQVRGAVERGIRSVWLPQIFGIDAITAIAVMAREFPDVRFGTAVVPTYARHPMVLGAQARTAQQVTGGNFTLGVGLSHQVVIEGMLGLSFAKPAAYMREYLDVLMPLCRGEAVDAAGERVTFHGALEVPSDPVPVLVAALGSKMLGLAGSLADGTVTWMTGTRTVEGHIAPTISAAASDAGRPPPRIVMALPTAVTDDPDEARTAAASTFEIYGYLPSYRAMLDREGAAGPAEVALAGSEDVVRAGIEAAFEAGATEFVAVPFSGVERTLDLVAGLL